MYQMGQSSGSGFHKFIGIIQILLGSFLTLVFIVMFIGSVEADVSTFTKFLPFVCFVLSIVLIIRGVKRINRASSNFYQIKKMNRNSQMGYNQGFNANRNTMDQLNNLQKMMGNMEDIANVQSNISYSKDGNGNKNIVINHPNGVTQTIQTSSSRVQFSTSDKDNTFEQMIDKHASHDNINHSNADGQKNATVCRGCGAPIAKGSVECEYCGARS